MQKDLKIKSKPLTAGKNSPDFSFSAYLNNRIKKIVLADDNTILSNETIDKLSALCDEFDIELLGESQTEEEPGFVIMNVILFNEGMKERKQRPTKLLYMESEAKTPEKDTKLERFKR